MPVWTTFYLNKDIFQYGTITFWLVQTATTLAFTILAVWLFRNITFENRDKMWIKLIFDGKEWTPIMKSMELLNEIDAYK